MNAFNLILTIIFFGGVFAIYALNVWITQEGEARALVEQAQVNEVGDIGWIMHNGNVYKCREWVRL